MKRKEKSTTYSELEYESLRDEALSMANTLNEIEKEAHYCAMCDGREDCGYSAKQLLKEICYIFAKSEGYHRMDKYNMKKIVKEKGTDVNEDIEQLIQD